MSGDLRQTSEGWVGVSCRYGGCTNGAVYEPEVGPRVRTDIADWRETPLPDAHPDPRSEADHGTDCGCWDYQRMKATLTALVDAVGAAAVVHLTAEGPIRLIPHEWQRITEAAIAGRVALDYRGEASDA